MLFFFFFFFEPLVFGIQINRCSGMGAEKYLSLRAPVSYVTSGSSGSFYQRAGFSNGIIYLFFLLGYW